MKIYVSTCDKYDHLLPGFAYLFNKYWGPDQEVHVLGFRQPPELPTNFVFHSMEPVETVPWSTNMRNFFSQIEDDHFIFLFDDYWLTKKVDRIKIDEFENLLVSEKLAKFDLTFFLRIYPYDQYKDGFLQSRRNNLFRLSTQPAIWTKSFWMKWMNPGLTPWQFEIAQDAYDDEVIVGTNRSHYVYGNMIEKGKPRQQNIDRLSEDEKKLLVVPLKGRCGTGLYSNVFVEQMRRNDYPDDFFEVDDMIITSISMMVRSVSFVIVACELKNATGKMIRNMEKSYTEVEWGELLGEYSTSLLDTMKKLVPQQGSSPIFKIYCDSLTAKKSYVISNTKGYLDLVVEKFNTQQLIKAITPMTINRLCDTVALLKEKLFI
jgi:hypothetical protein